MLLIYTQKITPRIIYIFKHICTHILGLEIRFTNKIEEFIAHPGMKFSYGKKRLGNEFFIQNTDLLLEHGLGDLEIKIHKWEETKCFFSVSEKSDLPFDIFAASFYMLSRYEEYMPHLKDDFGRFPASESLAFKEGFIKSPVVDIWAYKFKKILIQNFPGIEIKSRKFESISIISVSRVFNYKNKGFIRSLLGTAMNLGQLKFTKVSDRFKVLFRLKKDPFNVFNDLIGFIKKYKTNMVFMFQLSDFNAFDRNISPNRLNYISIIKYVADYSLVGLKLGYYAVKELEVLKIEKKRFENIIHAPLQNVLNSKYNLLLPEHYSNLNELEITNDYSMGYPEWNGFRAGTCTSFLFYDINLEITTPLKIHPYVFHSQVCKLQTPEEIQSDLVGMLKELKLVQGTFRSVFKNRDFSEYKNNNFYYSLLKQVHEIQ